VPLNVGALHRHSGLELLLVLSGRDERSYLLVPILHELILVEPISFPQQQLQTVLTRFLMVEFILLDRVHGLSDTLGLVLVLLVVHVGHHIHLLLQDVVIFELI